MNFESSGAKFFARLLRTLASYFDAASSPLKLEEEENEEEEEEKNAAKHRLERSKAIVHSARTRTILASQRPFRWGEKDDEEDFLSVVARGKEVLLDVPRREVVVVVVVVGNISNLCLQSVFQFFSRVVGDIMCFN